MLATVSHQFEKRYTSGKTLFKLASFHLVNISGISVSISDRNYLLLIILRYLGRGSSSTNLVTV